MEPNHIQTGKVGERVYWCGAPVTIAWAFVDATHALLSIRNGGGITPCSACLRTIIATLEGELRAAESVR